MSGLFSHQMAEAVPGGARASVVASVTVPAPADHAWAGLAEHIHLWWPTSELSRWGEESFFDLEDNALVETSVQEDEHVWAEVVDGRPGLWLELRWQQEASASSTVRMEIAEFTVSDDADRAGHGTSVQETTRTTLTVVHSGWTMTDSQELYEFYQRLWPLALGRYGRFMGAS